MFDKKKHSKTINWHSLQYYYKKEKRTIFDQNIWKSRSNDKHWFFSLSQKLSKQKFYAPSISSHDTIGWVKICFFKLLERKEQGWKGLSPTLLYILRKAMLGRRDHITVRPKPVRPCWQVTSWQSLNTLTRKLDELEKQFGIERKLISRAYHNSTDS